MNYTMKMQNAQVLLSGDGEVTTLSDRRFDWKERRERNMRLYELYEKAGYPEYAERTKNCATFLEFATPEGGERRLKTANFCKLRLCPMCISRRARRSAWKLSRVLDLVEQEHGAKFLFLTLTMKNVTGPELGGALGELTDAWQRFLDQRQIRSTVKGWFRAIEITRNGMYYHPHLHDIIAVAPDYFSRENRQVGRYLHQADLIDRWQRALRVDYRPSVRIQTTKAKAGTGEAIHSAGGRSAVEAAKYAVKDEDYIDHKLPEEEAIRILRDYTTALRNRRLTAFGGWMKEAARKLDAEDLEDGDLVHVSEDDIIRDDVKVLIERFNWHFGAGDYILSGREISIPLNEKQKEKKE